MIASFERSAAIDTNERLSQSGGLSNFTQCEACLTLSIFVPINDGMNGADLWTSDRYAWPASLKTSGDGFHVSAVPERFRSASGPAAISAVPERFRSSSGPGQVGAVPERFRSSSAPRPGR